MEQNHVGIAPNTNLCDNDTEKTREELLSDAFDMLLKLSPEQILKIMEGLK